MTGVPFADLHAQYLSIKSEIDAAIAEVIASSAFIRGPYVDAFEADFAAMMETAHCVSCSNGTTALYIAMHALGIRPGDEVITSAHSWISTSETISQHGAVPVFADIDPATYTIDPAAIEAKITPRTIGIIPVHLYGQPAEMDAIMAIARRHNLWVIEDCAQAHLATYQGRKVGTFGNVASWSFYPGKNLGAMGDAGALTTDDADLARRAARFARHGGLIKNQHEIEGINSRMDGLQAAILSVKLKHLARWTDRRIAAAARYDELLAGSDVAAPRVDAGRTHVYHLYVIEHEARDSLAAFLGEQGIQTAINYPTALPFLPAYARFGYRPEDFPATHAMQSRILSLPMFAEISAAQQGAVAGAIASFAQRGAKARSQGIG